MITIRPKPDTRTVTFRSRDRFGGVFQPVCGLVLVRRVDERRKQRMRVRRLGLEFGMELDRDVPRMARQLGNLDELDRKSVV